MAEQQSAVRIAGELRDALTGMSGRLDQVRRDSEERDADLKRYGHRNRLLIYLAAVGLALDIAASVVAVTALVQQHHNSVSVTELHDNNVSACRQGNARLVKQRNALNKILTIGGPPKTPQVAAVIAKAEGIIASGWSARDCQAIYALNHGRKP